MPLIVQTRRASMTQRTDAEHAKFKRAVAAHDRISAGDHFADWLAIGEAYAAVRDIAMRAAGTVRPHGVHYKRAWTEEMKNHAAWATYDPATRSQAIWLADNIGEVTRWRETLAINEREKFNHPAVVKRRYDAVHKEEGEFKNKPPSTVARLKEELEDSRGAVERMKREIETMKRSIDDFESRFNWD